MIHYMKQLEFKGNSLDRLREFPTDARQQAGYQLDKIQRGEETDDWKPMKTIGLGVKEIRIRTEDGTYRVIYVAKFADTVCVLNASQKKEQKTPQDEINIAKRNFGGISD
jgi:phage-related protein